MSTERETAAGHPVSATCGGEVCGICYRAGRNNPATHKVGEEIAFDDPMPQRHNLTQYVCCGHYVAIMGPYMTSGCGEMIPLAPQPRSTEGASLVERINGALVDPLTRRAAGTNALTRHLCELLQEAARLLASPAEASEPDGFGLYHDTIHRDSGVARGGRSTRNTPRPAQGEAEPDAWKITNKVQNHSWVVDYKPERGSLVHDMPEVYTVTPLYRRAERAEPDGALREALAKISRIIAGLEPGMYEPDPYKRLKLVQEIALPFGLDERREGAR